MDPPTGEGKKEKAMKYIHGFVCLAFLLAALLWFGNTAGAAPTIFDTDIGSDIDDTWALALLLCCPELDLKLVVTDSHDTTARAKIVAQFLERVRRTDVAVGIGVKTKDVKVPQAKWAEDYDLSKYPGAIHEDGVQAMIDVIQAATEPVRLIVVGPCPNIPVLLQRYPEVVDKVTVYAMSGSVRKGYGDRPTPDAEYNVREDIPASQKLYAASWKLTITPLDTCGIVAIQGEPYQKLIQTDSPLIRALYENYKVWVEEGKHKVDPDNRSTTLFDTVAVYLAVEDAFCNMENLKLSVDARGYTVIDPKARVIRTATEWKDQEGFVDWMSKRLQAGAIKKKN